MSMRRQVCALILRREERMRGLIAVFCLAAACGWANGARTVDFAAPGGVRCRLTAEGSQMWRLRTARGDGSFAEVGAAQSLARWMGEKMQSAPQPLLETAEGGARTFTSPDGSKAVMAADGSSLEFVSATGRKVVEVVRIAPGANGSVLAGRLLPREAYRRRRRQARQPRPDMYAGRLQRLVGFLCGGSALLHDARRRRLRECLRDHDG